MCILKKGIIITKYLRGDPIEDIKNEFEELVDMFYEKGDLTIYEENIMLMSMTFLLDMTKKKINLRNKLMEAENYDFLIDFIFFWKKKKVNLIIQILVFFLN